MLRGSGRTKWATSSAPLKGSYYYARVNQSFWLSVMEMS